MKNCGVLCFDCDGVVVNNTILGFERVNRFLRYVGLAPISTEFLRMHWGMKSNDLFDIICKTQGASPKQIIAYKKKEKEETMGGYVDPRFVKSLLVAKDIGFLVAMITSRSRYDLKKYAGEINLDLNIFSHVQTIDNYHEHKPSGKVFNPLFRHALQTAGYKPENVIYFGDTVQYDYGAVKNAQANGAMVKFVGVCSGIHTFDEFVAAGLNEKQIIPSHDVMPFFLDMLIRGHKISQF